MKRHHICAKSNVFKKLSPWIGDIYPDWEKPFKIDNLSICTLPEDKKNLLRETKGSRDASHSTKWFQSIEDAKSYLQEFANSQNLKLMKYSTNNYDVTSKKIFWDESLTPFIILACDTSKLCYGQDTFKSLGKNATVSILKTEKFPHYKLALDLEYNRKSTSKAIRKFLSSNDPLFKREVAYLVKVPTNTIKPCVEKACSVETMAKKNPPKCFHSMEEAETAVQNFERSTFSKFISYMNRKCDASKCMIQWDDTLMPFVTVQAKTLVCQHGKDRNKAYNALRQKQASEKLLQPKRKRLSIRSKKRDCNAKIQIRLLIRFPKYQMATENVFQQKEKGKLIRKALVNNDKNLIKESTCLIYFPDNDEHSGHELREDIAQKTIDARLVAKINQLVDNGIHTVTEIKLDLESYVVNELLKDRPELHNHYQRFMPKQREISNYCYLAYARRFYLQIDEQLGPNAWNNALQSGDSIVFRPRDSDDQKLLFVHQFDWQKKLLRRFGATACLLEATYKTFEYTNPLFFLAVKSNHGYHLVGSFITQNRTTSDIDEAFQVFKVWSTDWDSTFLYIHKSDEQIQAIEKLIPDCYVLSYGFQDYNNVTGNYSIDLTESWNFLPIDSLQNCQQKEDTQSRISNVLSDIAKTSLEVPSNRALIEAELELNKVLEKLKTCCMNAVQTVGEKIKEKRKALTDNIELPNKRHKTALVEKPPKTVIFAPQQYPASEESYKKSNPLEIDIQVPVSEFTFPLNETLFKNGPHNLSFLQLKSLEPTMSEEEKSLLVSQDPDFKVGWLYDEVINSYLWSLSKIHEHVIYASSTVAQIMQRRGSLKRLWQNVTLANKKYIFIPWNPTGRHWVLLVVDLGRKCLLYLDPQQIVCVETNAFVKKAKHFIDHAIFTKFKFHIRFVESMARCLQTDSASCGVFVCMYARWLANSEPLVQTEDSENDRQNIFDEIAGGCLNKVLSKKEICKICDDNIQPNWIQCTRCQHWLHIECVGLTPEEANSFQYFVCPLVYV